MLNLTLQREPSTRKSTPGILYVNGGRECCTLEDVVRRDPKPETPENEAKVYGQTAIPAGRYKVILAESPRFNRILPRLLDVPGFTGVLIHSGNKAEDTHGCILVGQDRQDSDFIVRSKLAMDALMAKLEAADQRNEEIWIHILDAAPMMLDIAE